MSRYIGRVQPHEGRGYLNRMQFGHFEPWREPNYDVDLLDERLRLHAHRGRYPCRYDHWRSDCDSAHCCQGGELVVKTRWQALTVRRSA